MRDLRPRRPTRGPRLYWCLTLLTLIALILSHARVARADGAKLQGCTGPEQCCPADLIEDENPGRHDVALGVVLIGLDDINEKASTWTADVYLYEAWQPAPGFVPQTEIFNEVSRISEQFDRTELADGRCRRSRRIRTVLHAAYNLRTFPFDHQTLSLELSDAEFDSSRLAYRDAPTSAGLDDGVLDQVSGWKIEDPHVSYARTSRSFKWEPGAPSYDYATFGLRVRRHVSFHLSKYFLPLLLIVIVAFSVFWIDPEDLASSLQIGVTCLLAAIALEFTEGSSLPDVSYVTLADRTYSIAYVAIGLAVLQSVYSNRLVRRGQKDRAVRFDARCRLLFPGLLAAALGLAWLRAYTQA